MSFQKLKAKKNRGLSAEAIKRKLNETEDLKIREIKKKNETYTLLYVATVTDQQKLETAIIEPLTRMDELKPDLLYVEQVKMISGEKEAIEGLMTGFAVLLQESKPEEGYLLLAAGSSSRPVSEIINEKSVLGSHEGFVESFEDNISLIRKRLKSPKLTVRHYKIGKEAPSDVIMVYVDGLAEQKVIQMVEERLDTIDLDFLRSAVDIGEYLEDDMYSTFPQLLLTESPERVAANLKDGKIALMMDGSSVIFVLPATFSMFFQTPDDYTARWVLGFFYRTIRYFGYVIALYLPAVYVAVASFHYELIPTELVYSFQQSLSYVPFRPVIELIGMQASLELLREASLRLPTPVAATFGIVGAIVVGTAMVEAGFISYGGLVVVAITAVSSFVQPNNEMSNSIRVLGFPLMIFASIFGFLGLVLGTLVAVIHLSRLETFGKPYFTPFAPLKFKEFKDTLIRTPVSMGKKKEKQKGKKAKKGWKLDEGENPY